VDVLKAADIDMLTRPKRATLLSTPTEVLIDDVLAVAKRLGRAPKVSEYAVQGRYSYLAVRGRLGGWKSVRNLVKLKLSLSQHEMSCAPCSLSSPSTMLSEAVVEEFFNPTPMKPIPDRRSE
jgi:Homing endonuclease associated repeat